MSMTRSLLALTTAAILVGCGHEPAELAEMQSDPVEVTLAEVGRGTDARRVEVRGVVRPARRAAVSSRVTGPVVELAVAAGDTVGAGDLLLRIQPATAEGQLSQAQGALAQAEAALALAERNLRRYRALHDEGAASDLELDMAEMEYRRATGAVERATGATRSAAAVAAESAVTAPFAATVVETLVEVGDLAAPGRPLVHVESTGSHQVWLTVPESQIRFFPVGTGVEVRLDSRPELGTLTATVVEVVPAADSATHTFTVKAALGRGDVASGLAARAAAPGDAVERLTIPVAAVHLRGGLELVVVRAEDGTARTRAVTTGEQLAGGRLEVLSGLDAGEQVAVDAPGPLADGTPLEVRR